MKRGGNCLFSKDGDVSLSFERRLTDLEASSLLSVGISITTESLNV